MYVSATWLCTLVSNSDNALHLTERLLSILRTGYYSCMQVESITNHDVKAIEYIIKERISHNPELAEVWTSGNLPLGELHIHILIAACCCEA